MGALIRIIYPDAPAKRLAALRVLLGGYAFFYALGRLPALWGVTRYPVAQFRPVGPLVLLDAPLPAAVVALLLVLTALSGAAFVLGWRFHSTGPAFGLLFLVVVSYRNSGGMVFHTENLIVLHTIVLALAPSADAWSLDARGRGIPEDSPRYGWPVQLICAVTATSYFIAGTTKLHHAGFEWVTSDTLRNFIAYDNVRKAELGAGHSAVGGWLVQFDWLFPPLAATSLGIELGAPLALLGRRIGMLWAVFAWGFHLGVLLLMFILFHYPLLGFAFASFFGVEKLGEAVERRLRKLRPGAKTVG
jgi:hypothetical protein